MISWESDVLSTDEREQFWQRVMDFETAPVSDFQRLTDAGMQLPEPDTMNDEQLTAKLWEVIHGLASMRVFLSETDHLSDRELYTELWQRVLREENPVLPDDPVGAWHVDLLGGCSEDDIFVHMKYYADEGYRQQWLADFPDYVMPAPEDPLFDRDRRLPPAYDEVPSDDGDDRPICEAR